MRNVWIYFAVFIALAGVVIHLGALLAGPSWFEFFRAPEVFTESARAGTWLAPVGGLVIAGLMGSCGYYAASTLGWVPRPPLQRVGLALMASVCLGRALLIPVLAVGHPELRNTFAIVAAVVWGTVGVGLAVAFTLAKAGPNNSFKPNPLRSFKTPSGSSGGSA